jgi:hypothetical protein
MRSEGRARCLPMKSNSLLDCECIYCCVAGLGVGAVSAKNCVEWTRKAWNWNGGRLHPLMYYGYVGEVKEVT